MATNGSFAGSSRGVAEGIADKIRGPEGKCNFRRLVRCNLLHLFTRPARTWEIDDDRVPLKSKIITT